MPWTVKLQNTRKCTHGIIKKMKKMTQRGARHHNETGSLTGYRRGVVVVWVWDQGNDGALRVKLVAYGVGYLVQAVLPRLEVHLFRVVWGGRDEEQFHRFPFLQRG